MPNQHSTPIFHRLSLAIVLLAIGSVTSLVAYAEEDASKLNVLFLVSDDLRPDLGCYGNKIVQSPNIDRLAERGMVFNRAYCQQAVCSPSRSSVMTGLRPDTTKVWDLSTHFRKAVPDVVTLPQLFKQNGYTSRGLGKIYHGSLIDPESWTTSAKSKESASNPIDTATTLVAQRPTLTRSKRGPAFRITDDPANGGGEGELADEAIEALQELSSENAPFFLAVGFHKPHLPFNVPKAYWDKYDGELIPMATNRFLPTDAPDYALVDRNEMWNYRDVPEVDHLPNDYARKLKHGYYAAITYMDAQLGRVMDEVDRLGLTENTIVVLWGDHGWKLGEHDRWCKHSNYENDTRAPLIVCAPGMKQAGRSSDALVEFIDIYPTIADLAGLQSPDHIEGTSLRPLMEDPNRQWKNAAWSQYPRTVKGQRLMGYSLRTDRYRFTRWVNRYDHTKLDAIELYDHQNDPQENHNIANDPANAEIIATLMKVELPSGPEEPR
ncbi:sulfatase [Neorhodopirellula lusitana]|uniref:sulfatase n=1 Tax=Neorhodopirellula lusitana TaxID=445327 RepID=UPI00384C7D7C